MSAATLREAAALMRSRAEAASCLEDGTPDVWFVEQSGNKAVVCVTIGDTTGDVVDQTEPASAAHIASWHPAVALAVADWLDVLATMYDSRLESALGQVDASRAGRAIAHLARRELTVARAYLGESA